MEWLTGLGLQDVVTPERTFSLFRAFVALVVGLLLARVLSVGLGKAVEGRLPRQEGILVRRFVYYSLFALVVATALHQLGFHLGVLLGAAGVLSVALGFASQTSASNLISGLFLIAERPFVAGDVITVDGETGEVLSIDLLSVKLRTYDNLYGVAYKEDLAKVEAILRRVADANPLCLDEPLPLFILAGFGDSAVEMQFSVWSKRENFLEMRNGVWREIKAAFDAEGIEIPFPHVSVYAGSATEPIPVRVTQ